jgi:hypothetical protein
MPPFSQIATIPGIFERTAPKILSLLHRTGAIIKKRRKQGLKMLLTMTRVRVLYSAATISDQPRPFETNGERIY